MLEWIRFGASALCILGGLCVLCVAVFGVYRFQYVMNRMHAAAMIDTLGIALIMLGLMLASGLTLLTLKLFLVVALLWLTSPVSSHLIARLEITTSKELDRHMEVKR